MADNRLPPMEEARVRTAALVAAQRMSWDVPRAVLDYIVATSDPRQGPAALEMRAAGIVEYVRSHPDRPDFANATDRQTQGFFQTIHGQVVHLFGGLPYVLASREEEAGSDVSGTSGAIYAALENDWDSSQPQRLNSRNWHRSPFCGIPGLDIPTTQSLLAAGYAPTEIVRAGRDVERLSRHFGSHAHLFTTPENIARATRLNGVAPGFMAQVDRHVGALAGIRETEGGIARDETRLREMETRGEGSSEAAVALRADIARRQEEARRRRQEAEAQMNEAVRALPETSIGPNGQTIKPREDAHGLVEGVRAADAAAAREAERLRLEAAERAAREAEEARRAAERARLAALMGEEPATKGPAIVVQEGPPTKGPVVQEGPASKEAPPVRLTAAPGS